jgi:hypothetical protein
MEAASAPSQPPLRFARFRFPSNRCLPVIAQYSDFRFYNQAAHTALASKFFGQVCQCDKRASLHAQNRLTMEAAIHVEGLRFPMTAAKSRHSFAVHQGQVTGLLDQRRGQIDDFKILTGILQIRDGRVVVAGFELRSNRSK